MVPAMCVCRPFGGFASNINNGESRGHKAGKRSFLVPLQRPLCYYGTTLFADDWGCHTLIAFVIHLCISDKRRTACSGLRKIFIKISMNGDTNGWTHHRFLFATTTYVNVCHYVTGCQAWKINKSDCNAVIIDYDLFALTSHSWIYILYKNLNILLSHSTYQFLWLYIVSIVKPSTTFGCIHTKSRIERSEWQ